VFLDEIFVLLMTIEKSTTSWMERNRSLKAEGRMSFLLHYARYLL